MSLGIKMKLRKMSLKDTKYEKTIERMIGLKYTYIIIDIGYSIRNKHYYMCAFR